jgi:hypothetical protein
VEPGHEGQSGRLTTGYKPIPGLISLFSKIGVSRQNPNHRVLLHQRCCRSYVEVVHNNMEQGSTPANFNRSGHGSCGFQPVPPRGAAQAEMFCDGFNMPYQGYGGGPYGKRAMLIGSITGVGDSVLTLGHTKVR